VNPNPRLIPYQAHRHICPQTHAIIILIDDATRSLNLAGARESYSGSVEIY